MRRNGDQERPPSEWQALGDGGVAVPMHRSEHVRHVAEALAAGRKYAGVSKGLLV